METVGLGVLETAVGVLWEPADWALTAFAIAQEPTNPWNYVGFIPFIPASVRHLGKVDNLVGGLARHGDEVVGPMKNLGGSIDDAAYKARTYNFKPGEVTTVTPPVTSRGRRTNRLEPNLDASGPHTTFKRDPVTGKIMGYETYTPQTNHQNPNPWQSQGRFDLQGLPHFNKATGEYVPTPHVHDPTVPGGVRPAIPGEIPGGGQ